MCRRSGALGAAWMPLGRSAASLRESLLVSALRPAPGNVDDPAGVVMDPSALALTA